MRRLPYGPPRAAWMPCGREALRHEGEPCVNIGESFEFCPTLLDALNPRMIDAGCKQRAYPVDS